MLVRMAPPPPAEKKIVISRLNPDFPKKNTVEPAQPDFLKKLHMESTQSDLYWPKNREGVCVHKQILRWKCQKLTKSKRFYCYENWGDKKRNNFTLKSKCMIDQNVWNKKCVVGVFCRVFENLITT